MQKKSEPFLSHPEDTNWVSRHRTLRTQYLHLGVFPRKQYIILASYKDFCKLQSFCLCSFTTLLFRHLPAEIVIFINVCHQISVSVVIMFPFLEAVFANVPPTFLISCEVQTRYSKTLKYSQQYI